jgi:hypothetical protein
MDALKRNSDFRSRPHPGEVQKWLDAPSHVYFILSDRRVKIGVSTNWRERVDSIIRSSSHDAQLILVVPGDRSYEQGLHDLFEDYRANGEWFDCEGKLLEFLLRYCSEEGREILELETGAAQ